MLRQLLLLLLLFYTYLDASDKVEIFASTMETQGDIVFASGEVNVVYQDYFISAKRAKYDRKSGDLELFDNVRVTQGKTYKILGKYARLNIKDKEREFKPFYMLEKKSKVWMSGENAYVNDKDIDIESGRVSGCNPNDPLWKMEFTSSDYNSQTQWLNMYNTRLYIYDIPVFYMPYFGYSLDTSRQTGILTPSMGISSDEGFYYKQPLYLALQNWWDLELNPQIRTNRGQGIYSTFRFVDSKISKGSLTFGYFEEKQDYFEENNLANKEHIGFDFNYDNSDFLNQWFGFDLEGQSAIYTDIHYLNDVDYLNLSTNDTTNSATSTQVLSRINLFYNNDTHYIGTYFKYYQDLTKTDNKSTLQKLPTLQYHLYLDTFLADHFLYNVDVQSTNYFRQVGLGAVQTDLNIPITLQTSLFNEYLNVAYKGFLYTQLSQFNSNDDSTRSSPLELENGYYARNYNVLKASTQITRAFSEYSHVMGFSTQYIFSGADSRSGFYEDQQDYCSNLDNASDVGYSDRCEYYNISDVEEALQLEFSQYLFDSVGSQKLYHKVSQNIVYKGQAEELGDLENELNYKLTTSINLYNDMFFNYDEQLFSKIYNRISFNNYGVSLSLSHLFKDTFQEKTANTPRYTSYLTSSLRYTYNEHYSYNAVFNYDLEKEAKKTAEIGFLYKKRCWDFGIRYVENNRPVLSNSGDAYNSIYDRYIYFSILLKPIMTSNGSSSAFTYKLPEVYKGS